MSPKLFSELTNQHGFIVIMFPNDHKPAHVHVYRGDNVARVNFEAVDLEVMDSSGFRVKELKEIRKLLKPYRNELIMIWNEMHPDIPYKPENNEENDE